MSSSESLSVHKLFDTKTFEPKSHRLTVSTGDPFVEAFVISGSLDLVARGNEKIDTVLPEGTYQVKFRAGDAVTEQWVHLEEDRVVTPEEMPVPSSSAPLKGSVSWDESERLSANNFVSPHSLAVVIRDPDEEIREADNVSIRSLSGKTFARLPQKKANSSRRTAKPARGWESVVGGRIAGLGGPATPGSYLLRVATPEIGTFEMVVYVAPGFKTWVYVTRKEASAGTSKRKTAHLGSCSMQMVAQGTRGDSAQRETELTEILRASLCEERPLPGSREIVEAVNAKYQYPMLGLLGAHSLHVRLQALASKNDDPDGSLTSEEKTEYAESLDLMKRAIKNLSGLLPQSADVGALGLYYGVALNDIDYGKPPMLYQSWSLIAPGASGNRIPVDSYAGRIGPGLTSMRPWLIWRTAQLLKADSFTTLSVKLADIMRLQKMPRRQTESDEVARAIFSTPMSGFNSIRDLAKSIGIPTSTLQASVDRVRKT